MNRLNFNSSQLTDKTTISDRQIVHGKLQFSIMYTHYNYIILIHTQQYNYVHLSIMV
jgi:hypothetical protein